MFNDTKYTLTYNKIIEMSIKKNRVKMNGIYYENHHILPKSLGGGNEKENLVLLTPREHFLVHWLLTKMVNDQEHKRKMHNAFYRLSHSSKFNNKRKLKPKQYEICRLSNAKAQLGKKYSKQVREQRSESITESWKNAEERKKKLRERSIRLQTGVPKPQSVKAKISKKLMGVKHPEWRNKRKSERQKKSYEVEKITGEKFIIRGLSDWLSTTSYNYKFILQLKKNLIDSYEDLKSIRSL